MHRPRRALSSPQAAELSADSTLSGSVARYWHVIGDEPKMLSPVKPLLRPLPKTLQEAITISQVEHPAIDAQLQCVDAAMLSVKSPSALLPSVSATAPANQEFDVNSTPGVQSLVGSLTGHITVHLYHRGQ